MLSWRSAPSGALRFLFQMLVQELFHGTEHLRTCLWCAEFISTVRDFETFVLGISQGQCEGHSACVMRMNHRIVSAVDDEKRHSPLASRIAKRVGQPRWDSADHLIERGPFSQ